MVMTVGIICLTVAPRTSSICAGRAPWIKPPTMAARKIQMPGVLTHIKESVPGFLPLKT